VVIDWLRSCELVQWKSTRQTIGTHRSI